MDVESNSYYGALQESNSYYGTLPVLPTVQELMTHMNWGAIPYFRRIHSKVDLPPFPPPLNFPIIEPPLPPFPEPLPTKPLQHQAKPTLFANQPNSPVNHNFNGVEGKAVVMHLSVVKPIINEVDMVTKKTTDILHQLNQWRMRQKRKFPPKKQLRLITEETGLSEAEVLRWLKDRKKL